MKPQKLLSIYFLISILSLVFFISPFKIIAQSNKEVIIDAIFLNNEQVILDNKECKLELKYNDVIKLVGRAPKNTSVSITFAGEKYTGISDEMGNWMILFSIPYIDDGKYEIIQDGSYESYCEVTLINVDTNSAEVENEDESDNSLIYVVILCVVVLSLGSYIFLSKKKKDKK